VKYDYDREFVRDVEAKVVEILGKFLKKEKDLLDKNHWSGLQASQQNF
jgi:hypothetical protein